MSKGERRLEKLKQKYDKHSRGVAFVKDITDTFRKISQQMRPKEKR